MVRKGAALATMLIVSTSHLLQANSVEAASLLHPNQVEPTELNHSSGNALFSAIAQSVWSVATVETIPVAVGTSAELMFANYLSQIGVKMYGAYNCPNSRRQRELFGAEAFSQVTYVECAAGGKNAQPGLCQSANIHATPTWEIKGHFYKGVRSLEQLARLTRYSGSTNFQNASLKR